MKSDGSPAVEVSNLTKRYGEVLAVNDVSFSVRQGELFGFLGKTLKSKQGTPLGVREIPCRG
jgi:ABC-2 type transport system ATP-binding protein